MIEAKKYDNTFYSEMELSSYKAAKIILPIISEIIRPKSVIDIGCGTGMWLKVWKEDIGVEDYFGVEGPYLEKEKIQIENNKILLADLKKDFEIGKRFEIAMSLEVAEHLPESVATQFVKKLTSLSDVVLFSGAMPGQIGTYHINEKYPEYWINLFKKEGFTVFDFIRDKIWNHPEIEFWYQQNIFLFVKQSVIAKYPSLEQYSSTSNLSYYTRIHPIIYNLKLRQLKNTETIWGFINWKWYTFKTKYLKKNGS